MRWNGRFDLPEDFRRSFVGTPQPRPISRTVRRGMIHRRSMLATFLFGSALSTVPAALVRSQGVPSRFPGPADFNGSYDQRVNDATFGGQSTYDGSITVTLLDRALVTNVLPSGYSLAARKDGQNLHPVILLIGHQRDLKYLVDGVLMPASDPDYQEVILLIPFVVRAGAGMKWHTFAVRMYLDDLTAIAIGNSVLAYAKQPATIVESGTQVMTTQVTPFLQSIDFQSDVTMTGSWSSATSASGMLPRWTDLQTIFAMPIVGVDTGLNNTAVREVCSYWEWDYSTADVAPTTSYHRFFKPFRSGMNGWVALGPLSNALDGAIIVRGLRWRIATTPPACQY